MHSVGNGNRAVVYDGKIAGLYDLEETLGSGHFAVVKLARHVFTGEKVAVKVIDKTKLDEVSRAHLFQEVRCMKLVQHPNVVRLYEVIDTQTKLYLILELGDGGDLYDYIMKHEGGLSEILAREYFRQIVRAISYCHQLHVVHRDLKPENVVFFEKLGVVKLTDFGFSNKFCPGQKLETSCGSLAYSAPEILLGDSYDAPAVDIWSLGVILYMLVCGQPPFEKANDSETLTMIMDCKYTMPAHVSSGCRKLIGSMLVREPEKRATLDEIAQDTWLIQGAQQEIVPEYLPLVSRQQVSDDDHTLIIQKMVNGNIATKEEILDALDRNEYNHITATYFLLAERKLRQQRQEQIQKRRPELSLPVSASSRNSPRSRMQGMNRDQKSSADTNNLLVPTSSQLSTPRTPGADTGGRSRKCSIVQEEDDEDEIAGCNSGHELSTPLNRRGSRSEGRINIALQDRVSDSERLKKDVHTSKTTTTKNTQLKGLEDICGIKRINKETNNVRLRLGIAGNSRCLIEGKTAIEKLNNNNSNNNSNKMEMVGERSNSVDQSFNKSITNSDITHTKVLIDSSTITIPLNSNNSKNDTENHGIPKYKTMPSPTRPSIILSGPRALNEIFEEGTDIGSSDSATTTPRPLIRNSHFTTNPVTTQRRSKFHKTRTPSCSSSDASDDDSESRKKRAHKFTEPSKPLQPQRRDSHDDSSDSQDQGPTPTSGNNGSFLICSTNVGTSSSSSTVQEQDSSQQQQQQQQTRTNGANSSSTSHNGRQKTEQQQPITFRRHRAGRRRAGETRLRESQSLNRITEVQESELPVLNSSHNSNMNNLQGSSVGGVGGGSNKNTGSCNMATSTTITTAIPVSKPKGLSARLFQGFIKKSDVIQQQQQQQQQQSPLQPTAAATIDKISTDPNSSENVDIVLGEFTKAIRVTESKSSSATKKLKMLGRYFQVHKKICIPLPGLFQRGRLYKAQSCGSIVRDKINPNVHNNTQNTRHSVLFTEKGKILRNCLGSRFLGNSDGDINQNKGGGGGGGIAVDGGVAQNCNLPGKKSSPLHQLGDVPLCSSKC